jgi:endonuclease YncB( thermonuclease family)
VAVLNRKTGKFLPALDQHIDESDVSQPTPFYYSPVVDARLAQGFLNSPLARTLAINYSDDAAILFARSGAGAGTFEQIRALSTSWKIGGAVGLVGAGVLAYGAFSNRFSGKDDAANTIQGFPERGFAKAQRQDFGSGWKGLRVSGQPISTEIQEFREKWYGSSEATAEMRRKLAASGTTYGEFDPEEIRGRKGRKTSVVDTSAYRMAWEDADTILLKSKSKDDIAIRLAGVDAPEIAHPGDPTEWFRYHQEQPRGQWALEQARAATAGHRVRLEIASDPKQRTYGRYIGLAYLEGHKDPLNIEMARSGIVASLPFGESGSDIYSRKAFISAEQEAINQNRGIWQSEFFQRYLEVSKGVGGRITLNTFTDLTRLSKNYHLAAAESFMSGEDPVDPRAGRRLGVRLIPSQGRFFSGRGRASNTNEGLRHGGIAGATRSRNTDFGSGLKDIFGGWAKLWQTPAHEVKKQIASWVKTSSPIVKNLEMPISAGISSRGPSIFFHKKGLRNIQEHIGSAPAYSIFVHEVSEATYITQLMSAVKESIQAKPRSVFQRIKSVFKSKKVIEQELHIESLRELATLTDNLKRFGSHLSPAVISDEALLSLKLGGRRGLARMRAFRQKEIGNIRSAMAIAERENPGAVGHFFKDERNYIERVEKIYDRVEKHWIPKMGEPVDRLEGMSEVGLASARRKKKTAFGSKYDLIRDFVKAGQSYEELLASETFKRSLAKGSVVKKLGEGLYGKVHLMRGEYEGKSFQYIRKTLHEDVDQRVADFLVEGGITDPELISRYEAGKSLAREGETLTKLSHTETIPSSYAFQQNALYMEKMEGTTLAAYKRVLGDSVPLPPEAAKQLLRTQQEMERLGIVSTDIHQGNLMYDVKTKRAAWVDQGMARYASPEELEQIHPSMRRNLLREVNLKETDLTTASAISSGAKAPSRSGVVVAEQLKQDKIRTWRAGVEGGRNHIRRTRLSAPSHVLTERRIK